VVCATAVSALKLRVSMRTPTASAAVTALPQQLLYLRPVNIVAGRVINMTQPPVCPGQTITCNRLWSTEYSPSTRTICYNIINSGNRGASSSAVTA